MKSVIIYWVILFFQVIFSCIALFTVYKNAPDEIVPMLIMVIIGIKMMVDFIWLIERENSRHFSHTNDDGNPTDWR
jgi:hypothetical protein